MLNSVKGFVVKQTIERLATNPDVSSTWIGALLTAVLSSKIDYSSLLGGDPNQIANLVGAVAVFGVCYLIGKTKKKDA